MTSKFWGLNASSFKMVKATDFKFDTHLLRDVTPRSWSPLPQLIVACPANNSSVDSGLIGSVAVTKSFWLNFRLGVRRRRRLHNASKTRQVYEGKRIMY